MKVLIVGQGGREHALAWKIAQSARKPRVYCAPGNAGMESLASCRAIKADDVEGLVRFAREERIDLTVVGPEAALTAGLVDRFNREGLKAFGPDKYASQIEGSKVFAKEIMRKLGIPTADFEVFDSYDKALRHVEKKGAPLVIKADGLAAGKGVTVAATPAQAREALERAMVKKVFGPAGERVVIEECLEGTEASLIAIADGQKVVSLASSQDHKRAQDGDRGPNTGGMGAYSPASFITPRLEREAEDRIFKPLVKEFAAQGHPFKGFIYAGVMLTTGGMKVLEFNVRFGDPEAQAILPRLETDLLDLIADACEGRLDAHGLKWRSDHCLSVVMASGGYPGTFAADKPIRGLEAAGALRDVVVFHAGTRRKNGAVVTAGGRVLNVTALGRDLKTARDRAYAAAAKIDFENSHYRRDIGAKALLSQSGVQP